ncbi:ClpP/crotonase-like domain-containing protein [Suillus occidentalis]|nr:ClpP/crotonase-like domain-containing protein [Suillus occidentalis]
MESLSTIIVEQAERVGLIKLNRPEAYNALSRTLIKELLQALKSFESDPSIGVIVLTGGDKKGFCAGADIKEQSELSFVNAYNQDYLKDLNDGFFAVHKPIIGVVNGIALGGGCELAMMCDILYASETAKFGQPEITLGTIPGAGGTQRLIRAVGKSKAMHMILTGETISAKEAEAAGLVAKVLPADQVLVVAMETATKIASFSAPVLAMAKEAVNEAEELGLKNGLHFESRLYHATFGLEDHAEGFQAFLAKPKRVAQWTHK